MLIRNIKNPIIIAKPPAGIKKLKTSNPIPIPKPIIPAMINAIPPKNNFESLIQYSLNIIKQKHLFKPKLWVFSVQLLRDIASLIFSGKTHYFSLSQSPYYITLIGGI